jgi:signal transduction histidine kinase
MAQVAALAVAYAGVAKLGLAFATIGHSVTLVWPPTGLALVALLLVSRKAWPGVAIGAFFVNATTPGVGLLTAAGIAAGNTLEAVVGAHLIRLRPFRTELDRIVDVLRLALLAGLVSTTLGATAGSMSLLAGGVIGEHDLISTWRVWWVGDCLGNLILAPALLCWGTRAGEAKRRPRWEALALAVTLLLATVGALTRPHLTGPYWVFPPLIWAALRFGPRGATAATLTISIVAVWSTVKGRGVFAASSLGDNLLALDAFLASVALTSLVLGATAAELSRSIRTREHFISIASHELRTPLTPLRLQLQRLLRGLRRGTPAMSPDNIVEALVVIERQVDRLTTLLEDVLDLTRLRLGRLTLSVDKQDLGALVREVVALLREALSEAGCTLDIESQGDVVSYFDRSRMGQVITNLLVNAMKHGGNGPIHVKVEGGPARVVIVVRDQGPGVPTTDQERIFGRFEGTSDSGSSGLGLGLYIVREIVEAHQGRITLATPPGGGAAFKIELPRRPEGLRISSATISPRD